ncbi:MAG: 23S rRNA (pseudouridine(1915)-N(3))-methyltransferase RlmH [Clostridia bacterium]|nr:23S rRNA (pseudouridine(1915)-N(3))-methyltransferase RlmH [Clostridia bacterium]NLF20150.1 23S rRNA (pseudouridine(1915)-N(3))-methyltransferase RlmH [Clostridiaceae bacterium]
MQVKLIVAGKVKEAWLRAGIAEYSKRVQPYVRLEIIEVKDAPDELPEERAKAEEGARLLAQVKPGSLTVALDLAGEEMDSPTFAGRFAKWMEEGGAQVNFLIAGSRGFSEDVLKQCQARLCMGRMTYPHQLARLIFLEQLYRACKILRNEKYHK